jgi:hypothetical protein
MRAAAGGRDMAEARHADGLDLSMPGSTRRAERRPGVSPCSVWDVSRGRLEGLFAWSPALRRHSKAAVHMHASPPARRSRVGHLLSLEFST